MRRGKTSVSVLPLRAKDTESAEQKPHEPSGTCRPTTPMGDKGTMRAENATSTESKSEIKFDHWVRRHVCWAR